MLQQPLSCMESLPVSHDNIVWGYDFRSKCRVDDVYDARLGHLNQIAVEIMNVALIPDDTAPSEMNSDSGDFA